MKRFITCLALLLGLAGTGYAQDAAPTTNTNGLLIEIDCYSGRRNPSFRVTDPEQIAKIKALLDNCTSNETRSADTPVITDKLGYRGCRVTKLEDTSDCLGTIYAFDVNYLNVLVHNKQTDSRGVKVPRKQARTDASAALESYLLELALGYGQLDTTMVERIVRR